MGAQKYGIISAYTLNNYDDPKYQFQLISREIQACCFRAVCSDYRLKWVKTQKLLLSRISDQINFLLSAFAIALWRYQTSLVRN